MAGQDGVEKALGRRWAEAYEVYSRGLDEQVILMVARHDRTTLARWGNTGNLRFGAVLRLNEFFQEQGRPGFLDAVTGVQAKVEAAWSAEQLDLSTIDNPAYLQLIEASKVIGTNPRELLERAGLLAESHIILLRDTDAISIHIGSRTVVSPDLFGRDIRDRGNRSYASLVFGHVIGAKAGATLHRLEDNQGNRYRSLRLPFRSGPYAPLEIATLPHAVRSTTNYMVRGAAG